MSTMMRNDWRRIIRETWLSRTAGLNCYLIFTTRTSWRNDGDVVIRRLYRRYLGHSYNGRPDGS